MASADLDHIRALLIAQTEEARPQPRSLFSRPREERRQAPLMLAGAKPAPADDPDAELLLETIIAPAPRAAPQRVEQVSPLPPPTARESFGRRPDVASDPEPALDPGQPLRRLRVLDDTGAAIGEMIILADEGPIVVNGDEPSAVPYFPEDLLEPEPPRTPQPMRPWITALRNSGSTRKPTISSYTPKAEVGDDAPLSHQVRSRRAAKRAAEAPPLPAPSLGRDLLEALALSLTRELDALTDRLLVVASDAEFRRAMAAA